MRVIVERDDGSACGGDVRDKSEHGGESIGEERGCMERGMLGEV